MRVRVLRLKPFAAAVLVFSAIALLVVATGPLPDAAASVTSSIRDSSAFGGYVAIPTPNSSQYKHSEGGSATFTVPTLSCTNSPSSFGEVQMGQFIDVAPPPNYEFYTGASVVAACESGETSYETQLNACGDGSLCQNCPSDPLSVAPGTEVTVGASLNTVNGQSLWTSTISDASDESSCSVFLNSKFSLTPIFTGVCVSGPSVQGSAPDPLLQVTDESLQRVEHAVDVHSGRLLRCHAGP